MKTILSATTLFVLICSCNVEPGPTYQPGASTDSSEAMARQVIAAFQHMSSQEYVALFPTLREFHQMMETNSVLYGKSISDAKSEFADTYQNHLINTVKDSFERIIREGTKKGIVWNSIHFERIESSEPNEQQFGQAHIAIAFTAGEKHFTLDLKRALIMNSQWKVSQFATLIETH